MTNTENAAKIIARAIETRNFITFGYIKSNGSRSVRRVAGHILTHRNNVWYLIGTDMDKEDVRSFYVGQMSELKVEKESYALDSLPV